ncbi:MAG: hypothetical protein V3U29_10195 [Phycisphaeraceae bacterium]
MSHYNKILVGLAVVLGVTLACSAAPFATPLVETRQAPAQVVTSDNLDPARLASAPRFRLGAGDALGQALFERYTTAARSRQTPATPQARGDAEVAPVAARPAAKRFSQQHQRKFSQPQHQAKRWTIAVRIGQWLIRLDGADGTESLTVQRVTLELRPAEADSLLVI